MPGIYIPEQDEDRAYDDWRQRRDDDAAEEAAHHQQELLRQQEQEIANGNTNSQG